MSLEYTVKTDSVTKENLKKLSSEGSVLAERRICELSELAFHIADCAEELKADGMDICEILSLISDSIDFSSQEPHDRYMDENLSRLMKHSSMLSVLDKTYFTSLLIYRLAERGIFVSENDFLPNFQSQESFVYVKNSYSDEAYDVFSQDFSDPRVRYAKDFKEALSLVSDGTVGYCLLPLEDSGVRIKTVEELIFKTDMKINSVTPVFGLDGTADMKYCLVSHSYLIAPYTKDDDRYLELRISKDNDTPLSELICAAESLGLELYRVNCRNFVTDDMQGVYYSLLFKSGGGDFTPLLAYLTLFTEECTTLGIYKNLE